MQPRDPATVSLPPKSQKDFSNHARTHAPAHLGSQLSPLALSRLHVFPDFTSGLSVGKTHLFHLLYVLSNVSGAAKLGWVLEKPCSHTPGLADVSLRRPLYNPNHQTHHHHHRHQPHVHCNTHPTASPIPSNPHFFFSSDFDFPPPFPHALPFSNQPQTALNPPQTLHGWISHLRQEKAQSNIDLASRNKHPQRKQGLTYPFPNKKALIVSGV
ncbi:hypothetical protein BDP81DRAFT_31707 [Colletotrichum phormii]|uniref:Uncharacterized protein n=1 Tax=Colletotrichum phormii TaxID=359342 RepID=A0AAI9ZPY8_9PEZI|nr:uncharacterized protein BDP81DRAFT_31707 [Colletotrichum phormii]KAK1635953.1 hypothetical protein BDP81DRAFT_31707 [Colletotrichum phormii]